MLETQFADFQKQVAGLTLGGKNTMVFVVDGSFPAGQPPDTT